MSKPDGGPAFPQMVKTSPGMSLRDWFAGQYMAANADNEDGAWDSTELAKDAYAVADAMLAERGKS